MREPEVTDAFELPSMHRVHSGVCNLLTENGMMAWQCHCFQTLLVADDDRSETAVLEKGGVTEYIWQEAVVPLGLSSCNFF